MNRPLRLAVPLVFLALAACSSRPAVSLTPLPDRPWTILPGDEVRVRVYREPDLSGQWVVNSRGEALLPGLGKLAVAGLTVDSVTDLISNGYARRIIDAIVDVGIVRMVPMMGEVRLPGIYAAEPTMTVQQMVAKAGGLTGTIAGGSGSSRRAPIILLQKGRDGARFGISVDQRLDRVPVEAGDAILVLDPNPWDRRIEVISRYAVLVSLALQILMFSRQ